MIMLMKISENSIRNLFLLLLRYVNRNIRLHCHISGFIDYLNRHNDITWFNYFRIYAAYAG